MNTESMYFFLIRNRKSIIFYGAIVLITALILRFVACLAVVHGPSMEDTLHDGQVVLVWRFGYTPEVGDIVVTNKNNPFDLNLIKRVIAIENQNAAIHSGQLLIDGIEIQESYLKEFGWDSPDLDLTIPVNHVFLMGDNRNASNDSRSIGCIAHMDIIGKVICSFSFSF